ncbi:cardiolipin synthase [Paenibacillus agricola]|uniref:Cardiolipin synthase n=1 Tax=Paenibacillus agricola TaxID=2716264 RepID=A0ABX0J8W9_9BACL|nr:cardiolipin synthase [Paenibacillus agricola]NHN31771.1 cardiolipin synthase [Paenibacillus agricola]
MEIFRDLYSLVTVLNVFFAIAVIFVERRNIGVTWAWLMILFFLPGVGAFLYIFLGQNLSKRKIYRIRVQQQKVVTALAGVQKEDFKNELIVFKDPAMHKYQDMIYMNLNNAQSFFTQDNEVEIFTDGSHKFDSLLQAIKEAQHHVHLMYYIIRNDVLGRRLVEALTEKAKEGVSVRFLCDAIGSTGLPRHFFRSLVEAGGEAAFFFPSRLPYVNFRLNYRNHRKLAIIDGKCGYIGGFNIGDEYLGLDQRFGFWRDTHLKIYGGAVFQIQAQFILDWNLASPYDLEMQDAFFPSEVHIGKMGVQIVSSGPNDDREQIKMAYMKLINEAKSSLYMQTPYFVPDESFLNAVKMAALSGVDVRMMIPSIPDHKIVYWATYSYLGDLLEAGVKIYLYHKGFLHAKTIVVDGQACSVGTTNIDIRSFKLNFEVNAFIYDQMTASNLALIFEKDMQDSSELTMDMYTNRSRTKKFKESLARLLSPIL